MKAKKRKRKRLTEDQKIIRQMQELDKKCLRLAKMKERVSLFCTPEQLSRLNRVA